MEAGCTSTVDLHRQVLVKAELLELTGEISDLPQIRTLLPYTEFYWPPRVSARAGPAMSHVTWSLVPMSLDDNRGT